jgi:quercetin dioxygenase-like cupin family protein
MKIKKLENLTWKKRYSYIKNIAFTEKDLQCVGTKFQIVTFLPHTSIKPHYHKKTTEIFYTRSGRGILKLNHQKFLCSPDDFFLCEPGDIHEFINDTNKEFTVLIFKTNEIKKDVYWI